MKIKSMIEELLTLTDEQWGGYAFYHEPLERKLTSEQKLSYTKRAIKCGNDEAMLLREEYPQMTAEEISKELGFEVKLPLIPSGGGHVIFAQYTEPSEITVYMDCVKKAEDLITSKDLCMLFPDTDLKEILIAHELFHGIEYRKRKEIFTQTEKIELWRKPFSNKSRLIALSEMAAMAFAKKLSGIDFSPYVLDVLLMYSYNSEAAEALFEEIMEAAGIRDRKEK